MMCTNCISWPCYLTTGRLIPDDNRIDVLLIELQIQFRRHSDQQNLLVFHQTANPMTSVFRTRGITPEKLNFRKISGVRYKLQFIKWWRCYYQLSAPQLNPVRLD